MSSTKPVVMWTEAGATEGVLVVPAHPGIRVAVPGRHEKDGAIRLLTDVFTALSKAEMYQDAVVMMHEITGVPVGAVSMDAAMHLASMYVTLVMPERPATMPG
jgi:hypothetical protein